MQEEEPSYELKVLVTYVQKAYAPIIFAIVMYPGAENGSHHYFNLLMYSIACLSEEHFQMISNEFSPINSYWAHPECLLYCGLVSPLSSNHVKQRSLELILEFRNMQRKSKRKTVRKFIPPEPHELNFHANDLIELVNWDTLAKSKKTPPPILKDFSDEDLHRFLSKNTVLQKIAKESVPKFKCHSQDCERNIQLTSKTVLKTKGHDTQKARIIVTQDSREKFPSKSTVKGVIKEL